MVKRDLILGYMKQDHVYNYQILAMKQKKILTNLLIIISKKQKNNNRFFTKKSKNYLDQIKLKKIITLNQARLTTKH